MTKAITDCRALARLEQANGAVLVFLEGRRSERAFNCLSKWIFRNPQSGFQKFGYVGSEQQGR